MFVPKSVPLYIYAFEGYLPDLQAKLDGKVIPILPHTELPNIVGAPVPLDTIKAIIAEMLRKNLAELVGYDTFAVVRFPVHEDTHMELVFTWIEKIDRDREIQGILTKSLGIRPGFRPIQGASLYVDIRTVDKYEISKHPILKRSDNTTLKEGTDYTTILEDNRHYAFRLGREVSFDITVECKIIIPLQVRAWAALGLGLGLGVVAFALGFYQLAGFQYVSALAAGTVAGLFGLRVVLLHDIELLKYWHSVYIVLILLMVCTVAGIAVYSGLPK